MYYQYNYDVRVLKRVGAQALHSHLDIHLNLMAIGLGTDGKYSFDGNENYAFRRKLIHPIHFFGSFKVKIVGLDLHLLIASHEEEASHVL